MSVSDQLGRRRHADVPQGRIHYREVGAGDPIVFLHGVLVNGDLWRNVVPALAGGYRCIVPDWPLGGHHEPMRRDADLSSWGLADLVASFLDALGLATATLVGNDTGGAICQLVVARHPERIERLVLASCDAYEVYPPRAFWWLPLVGRVPGLAAITSHSMRLGVLHRSPAAFGLVVRELPPRKIRESYVRSGYRRSIRHDTRKVLRGITNADTQAAARTFGRFTAPVLIAWAAEDKLFPQSLADRLAADFPQARRARVAGSRTFVPEDEPEQLAHLIAEFMRQDLPTVNSPDDPARKTRKDAS